MRFQKIGSLRNEAIHVCEPPPLLCPWVPGRWVAAAHGTVSEAPDVICLGLGELYATIFQSMGCKNSKDNGNGRGCF